MTPAEQSLVTMAVMKGFRVDTDRTNGTLEVTFGECNHFGLNPEAAAIVVTDMLARPQVPVAIFDFLEPFVKAAMADNALIKPLYTLAKQEACWKRRQVRR